MLFLVEKPDTGKQDGQKSLGSKWIAALSLDVTIKAAQEGWTVGFKTSGFEKLKVES